VNLFVPDDTNGCARAQQRVAPEGSPMRPLFSLWSDYGTSARRRYVSAGSRRNLLSTGRKLFLTAVIVIAAVIGVRELYGQAVDTRGPEPTVHAQTPPTPSANRTGRRFASVAAIPLSPQPAPSMDSSAAGSPALAATPVPSSAAAPVLAAGVSDEHAIPPALTAVPGALAKAAVLPQLPTTLAAVRPVATSVAMKSAGAPKSVSARNVLHVAHRARHDGGSLAGYAEALAARFGHGREMRAALQSFL
jgi:hypothetical protein